MLNGRLGRPDCSRPGRDPRSAGRPEEDCVARSGSYRGTVALTTRIYACARVRQSRQGTVSDLRARAT